MQNQILKVTSGIFLVLFMSGACLGQITSSAVSIDTVYSADESHFLRSIPYDNKFPTLRGRTEVYRKGTDRPLYVISHNIEVFDSPEHIALSNDGRVIVYLVSSHYTNSEPGLMALNIFRDGKFLKGYSKKELTGCDEEEIRDYCYLVYFDNEGKGAPAREKGVELTKDELQFLTEHSSFFYDQKLVFVDFYLKVHTVDVATGRYVGSQGFKDVYSSIRDKPEERKLSSEVIDSPDIYELPDLKKGESAASALGRVLGLKSVEHSSDDDRQFKTYKVWIEGSIVRGGKFEVEKVELEEGSVLTARNIREFFENGDFDDSALPSAFEKWYVGNELLLFRKSDDDLARKEKEIEVEAEKMRFEERQKADTIDGRYIPADLGESMLELDKILTEADKAEFRSLPNRDETVEYHFGFGMWLRNNWHLWGGSRLQKYFFELGVSHPDEMSGIILEHYYDWLKGDTGGWKKWEEARREGVRKAKQNENRKH